MTARGGAKTSREAFYDSLHRMTQNTNGAGAQVGYGYDLKGQLTSLVYPSSAGIVTRAYDDAGRLQSVTDWLSHTSTFAYDAASHLVTINYGRADSHVDSQVSGHPRTPPDPRPAPRLLLPFTRTAADGHGLTD